MGLFSTDADPERKEIDPMTNGKKVRQPETIFFGVASDPKKCRNVEGSFQSSVEAES